MNPDTLVERELTASIIGAFYEVYNTLRYGFREHLYVKAMEWELRERGHAVTREGRVKVFYKGHVLGTQKIDLLVDQKVVVEVKATAELTGDARAQLTNYLRSTSLEVGLLLHFGPEADFARLVSTDMDSRKRSRTTPATNSGN